MTDKIKDKSKTKSKNSLEGFELTHITAVIGGKKKTWKVRDKYPYERKTKSGRRKKKDFWRGVVLK